MTDHSPTLYLTTAIPFVNAPPHLGFALELCVTDAIARHARARGRAVRFATGSDDHSLKNVLAAERAGLPTATLVEQNSRRFQQLAAALAVTHDTFVSTSAVAHHRACVAELWRRCSARGDLYRQTYSGLYCVGCERFAEPDETGCDEHPQPLELVSENNWFFRLSRYRDVLRAAIEQDVLRLTPSAAREESLASLRQSLPDVCVSRSATRARGWGIPVPGDPEQVIWVWFDALAYYLTALGFESSDTNSFASFWQSDSQRLHVIGKGITRFHAILWPAILSSAGLSLPSDLLVHGYLTLSGAKISKSSAAFDPTPLLEEFGADAVRYYLLRHIRTTRDGDFCRERIVAAYNNELANGLGNLVNRSLALWQRANGGALPSAGAETSLTQAANVLPARIDEALARFAIDEALDGVFELIAACNRYLDQTAPWALIKRGETQAAIAVLGSVFESLRILAAELPPFLPLSAARLQAALEAQGGPPAALQLFPRRADELTPTVSA